VEREIDMYNDFSDLESDDEDEDEEDEAAAEEAGIITKEEGGEEEEEEEDDDELEEDDEVMSAEHFYVFKARRGADSGHESETRHCSLTARRLRAAGVLP